MTDSRSEPGRETVDVIIVGGGPVGMAAAIEARLAGLTVTVCEHRATPIDKACGEGLMPAAMHALERLGVSPRGRSFEGIRYIDDDHLVEHRFRAGPGRGVRRTELHEAMDTRLRELGIRVEPVRVSDVAQTRDGVVVDGRLRSRWLLACDGLNSRLRRSLGLAGKASGTGRLVPATRYGIRQHFRLSPWSEFVEVHWGTEAEVYVTPVGDHEVGVAVLGPRGVDYDDVIGRTRLVAAHLRGAEAVSSRRGAGPLRQQSTRRVAGRILLVGDAAGYVDALTGEGIALGLAEANAAVAAILAGDPAAYERAWPRLTRSYRMLTTGLVAAATRPRVRRHIVPLAARLPRLYGRIIEQLAGSPDHER